MLELICLVFLISLTSCGKTNKEQPPAPVANTPALHEMYITQLASAQNLVDANGWLTPNDCDGMIWAGKSACGGLKVNILAAEYPDQPGRFNRHPQPFCDPDTATSKTSWSRDMGIAGLLPYALCARDLPVLQRHAAYGNKKNWVMGEPFADGRVVYTPSMIGVLYQLVFAMGGEDSPNRVWPSVYPGGLKDYEAHLQMMDIWIRGEITPKLRQTDLLDITDPMLSRIKDHVGDEPECPFYNYMLGFYTGDMAKTVDLLLNSKHPNCLYVRGDSIDRVDLAEWLFVANLALKKLEGK